MIVRGNKNCLYACVLHIIGVRLNRCASIVRDTPVIYQPYCMILYLIKLLQNSSASPIPQQWTILNLRPNVTLVYCWNNVWSLKSKLIFIEAPLHIVLTWFVQDNLQLISINNFSNLKTYLKATLIEDDLQICVSKLITFHAIVDLISDFDSRFSRQL